MAKMPMSLKSIINRIKFSRKMQISSINNGCNITTLMQANIETK